MIDTESFFDRPAFYEQKNWLDDLKNELSLQKKKPVMAIKGNGKQL